MAATLALVLTLVLVCDIVRSRPLLPSDTVINTVELGANFLILSVTFMGEHSLAFSTVSAMGLLLHCRFSYTRTPRA